MDFFTPLFDIDKLNTNFRSVLISDRKPERELFNQWAAGFVDRDGKLVKEFQTTFNSVFWEIYLYAAFKEYGHQINWYHSAPDFSISTSDQEVIVEAVTSNSAIDKPNEWDKTFDEEELSILKNLKKINIEAIIRLSNAILQKYKKYNSHYARLEHVKGKPFVIAVAPFEQPYFNHQYDRAIRALLYDHYVDEDAYMENPSNYPFGPPVVNLGFVEKDNGAEIPLGFFNDSSMNEVSAIIFSCVATWGKLAAMSENDGVEREVASSWAS